MKKILSGLLVASFLFSLAPNALALSRTMAADGTWASSGVPNTATAVIADAVTGDAVNITTNNTLTVTNNGVANNGGGLNAFSLGAITNSGTNNALISITTGSVSNLAVTIASANIGSNFTVLNVDANNAANQTTVSGALTIGGTLTVTNAETTVANNVTLTVTGALATTGVTTLNSGTIANSDAILIANGTTVTGTGGFLLNDQTGGGLAKLTLTGASAQTVTGVINGNSVGEGTLTAGANANATFVNTIGATNSLLAIVESGTNTLAFGGNVRATTLTFSADGTATMANATTLTAAVNNTTTNNGTLTLGASSAVVGAVGNTGTGLKRINATSTSGATITGNTLVENISAGSNTLAIIGTLGMSSATAGNLALTVNSGTSFGRVTTSGNATVGTNTTVAVTVGGFVPSGSSLVVVNDATGAGNNVAGGLTVTSSSPNVTFTANAAAADDLTLTATRNNVIKDGNGTAVVATINNLGDLTGDMSTVIGALDALTTISDVSSAVNQLDPIVNSGATAVSFDAVQRGLGVIKERLADVRHGTAAEWGVSTGDFWKNEAYWVKGFGGSADQGARKGINGYEAKLWGLSAGMDGLVDDNTRLGFSGGYSGTNVDNKGESGSTDVQSYQGAIYLGYDDPSPWYGSTGFSFAWNRYDGSRRIVFSGVDRSAKAEYDGQQYTGFGDIGYVIKQNEFDITPMAGLTYSHLNLEKYTETGAEDLNLMVASQGYDLFQQMLGAKLARPYVTEDGTWTPEIHFKWLYDYIGDKVATSSTFTGGGSSFTTNGAAPDQSSYNFGGGLTFYSKGNVSITGTYDLELKDKYTAHTGQAVMRYTF